MKNTSTHQHLTAQLWAHLRPGGVRGPAARRLFAAAAEARITLQSGPAHAIYDLDLIRHICGSSQSTV